MDHESDRRGPRLASTVFVGRKTETAEVRRLIGINRLLTLVGMCGIGKSRLAEQALDGLAPDYPGGVWWVDVSSLDTDSDLLEHVRAVLAGRTPAVADRPTLLVLDTCEDLLDACATAACTLLAEHPRLRLLGTSVVPLGVPGEQLYPVPPLRLTPNGAPSGPAEEESDAVRLLVQRTATVVPHFVLDGGNRDSVRELCRRLDGIPLAIELAAVRLRALSVDQLLDRLPDRHRLLTGGRRLAEPRHRDLRAAAERMFALCGPWERLIWTRLTVFVDGFDLAAAEAVCRADPGPGAEPADAEAADSVVEAVVSLVEKSVLTRTGDGREVRYRMPETLRLYGYDRLTRSADLLAVHRRHRDWFVAVAERNECGWLDADLVRQERAVTAEGANLRAALDFSLDTPGELPSAQRLVWLLTNHRGVCPDLAAGRRRMERVLELSPEPTPGRGQIMVAACWVSLLLGEHGAADRLLAEARVLAERLDDRRLHAQVVQFAGLAAVFRGEPERGARLLAEAVTGLREAGDPNSEGLAYGQLVMARAFAGDPRAERGIAQCLRYTDPERTPVPFAYVLWYQAVFRWRRGDADGAAADLRAMLAVEAVHSDQLLVMFGLETLAWAEAAGDSFGSAARLLGAADAIRRAMGTDLSGLRHLFGPHTECVQRVRAGLGTVALEREFDRGARRPLAEILAPAAPTGAPATPEADLLTPRQWQVVALIERGLSNREIAEHLVIALRTAESHVEHVMVKLGFTRRSQIAAWSSGQRRR